MRNTNLAIIPQQFDHKSANCCYSISSSKRAVDIFSNYHKLLKIKYHTNKLTNIKFLFIVAYFIAFELANITNFSKIFYWKLANHYFDWKGYLFLECNNFALKIFRYISR